MQFNTFVFLFAFLPLALIAFWIGRGVRWRMAVLVVASYVFYFYWDFFEGLRGGYTAMMIGSTAVNYFAGKRIAQLDPVDDKRRRKALMIIPILINLSLLATFKYAMFGWNVIGNLSTSMGLASLSPLRIILPIGISFYTFEAISYVVDIYRGATHPARSFLEYACFISMFPREISGPIVRYSDLQEQFERKRETGWRAIDWPQFNSGLVLLCIGMIKKVLIADRLAEIVNPIWGTIHGANHVGAAASWAATLGYTYQLYFDFSGYSDMAVGLACLFGLRLPQNFDSPYKSTDASDFWRRWHITLSSWLRDYLYIPLGGNRTGHRMRNLLITMLLGGLWHGAAWQFILWGGWHGLLLVVYHQLRERKWMPSDKNPFARFVNCQVMFLLVVAGWVLFRAPSLHDAGEVFAGWFGHASGGSLAKAVIPVWFGPAIVACWMWCLLAPNSFQVAAEFKQRIGYAILAGASLAACVFYFGSKTDFLYFQF